MIELDYFLSPPYVIHNVFLIIVFSALIMRIAFVIGTKIGDRSVKKFERKLESGGFKEKKN